MTDSPPQSQPQSQPLPQRSPARAVLYAVARAATSLPGKLLGLAACFVLLAEVLIFLPSAANFRTGWLMDRAQAAHLAAIAAENAAGVPSETMVRELLAGADVVAVARVYDGVNELVLGGRMDGTLINADLTREGLLGSFVAVCGTFLAPEGRYINITAIPPTRPDELISVIVAEAPLRRDLLAFSARIAGLSIFISLVTGGLIYISLLFLLVRPMRRLARAMTAFQEDPSDPGRAVAPTRRRDEIGEAERALAAMQSDVRTAFLQRERLAALGGAVAKINHDLRNVLASAQLISDRLAMSSDERVAGMGARLVKAIDRGARLCRDTLEYGRSQEHRPELVSVGLSDALDDAAGDAFAALGAVDWINHVADTVQVEADPDHLHRIFLNLFRNAIQAMDGQAHRQIEVMAVESAGRIGVHVRDTGPGIPERVQATLFQPFGVTAGAGGSGLGLSIVRELVRAMGGEARLVSTGADGTVFEVGLGAAQGLSGR